MTPELSNEYRQKVCQKIRESQQLSSLHPLEAASPIEIEAYICGRSKSKDEYLESIAKILYHLRKRQQPPNVNATCNLTTLSPAQPESKQTNQVVLDVLQMGVITQGNTVQQNKYNHMICSEAANNRKITRMKQQRPINQIVSQQMMPRNRQPLNRQIPNYRINIMAQTPQRALPDNRNMSPQNMNEIGQFHGVMPKNPHHGEPQQMIRMNGMVMRPQKKMNTMARHMPRFIKPILSQFSSDMSFSQHPTQCTGSPVMNHISPHQITSVTPCSPSDSVARQESVGCPSIGCDSRTPFPTRVLDTSRPHIQQPSVSEELTPYDKIYIEMVNHLQLKYADTFNNIRMKLPQDYSEMDRFALELWKILENPQKMVSIPTLGNYDRILEGTELGLRETGNCYE